MSKQTVNLSANEVLEQLGLGPLPCGWTKDVGELDTVCVDSPEYALGYIVTLNIRNIDGKPAYDFTVHEFCELKETGKDYEYDNTFSDYEQALYYIVCRIEGFKDANNWQPA